MSRYYIFLIFICLFCFQQKAYPYLVKYKEQYYRLFHVHLEQYPDDTMENIAWLEKAVEADFANPLYALAFIENTIQWEKYRYLFMMHINLKIIEQYIYLGNKWNKRNAFFYNAPWKEQNIKSIETAESCYKTALYYWKSVRNWADKAREKKFYYVNLPRVRFWDDEALKIETGELDYERTINRELEKLYNIRSEFTKMDNTTY